MTEKSDIGEHVNYNEAAATIYDTFLHLIHISYSVNDHSNLLSHFNESQPNNLEEVDNCLQEDNINRFEQSMIPKSENQKTTQIPIVKSENSNFCYNDHLPNSRQ